jgi:hypothetical protein
MRTFLVLLLAAATLPAADTLSAFGHQWDVVQSSDWKVEGQGASQVLELIAHRGPLPGPRRPIQFALARTPDFAKVRVELDTRPRGSSLMIVFAYRDPAHFDYAHLSVDTGIAQPVHNGIFHVFGGERVRISSQAGPGAFTATNRWHHVLLTHNGQNGSIQVLVDGRALPALRASDLSLSAGRVGLGSFDEVGDFKNVKITGDPAP